MLSEHRGVGISAERWYGRASVIESWYMKQSHIVGTLGGREVVSVLLDAIMSTVATSEVRKHYRLSGSASVGGDYIGPSDL